LRPAASRQQQAAENGNQLICFFMHKDIINEKGRMKN
jgi:hypothetical protein